MTGSPGAGDDDLVAYFSDPELRHDYAEYPAQPSVPAGGIPPTWGPLEAPVPHRSSPRRLIALLIVALIVAVAAGLVVGLAH